MNKKGFTLVELIAVLVLMGIVAMLTFPSIINLANNNKEKEFTTYKDMMVETVKTIPRSDYDSETYICLNRLGIEKFNENMTCNGYVLVSDNVFIPYLSCKDKENNILYEDNNFSDKGCEEY